MRSTTLPLGATQAVVSHREPLSIGHDFLTIESRFEGTTGFAT